MRTTGLAVGLALCLVLAGCLGTPGPATRTSTDPSTTASTGAGPDDQTTRSLSPSPTCTMTGGHLVAAVPIDPGNATDGAILAYENLSTDHRSAFDRMLEGDYQGHPMTPDGFPAYVRYDGRVYEPVAAGAWDRFC